MISLINTSTSEIYKSNAAKLLGNNDVKQTNSKSSFSDIYEAAINMVDETSKLEKASDKATLDFMVGNTDSIHDVMIAQEKAMISLQFTTAVRDKALEAYSEIMRMQV